MHIELFPLLHTPLCSEREAVNYKERIETETGRKIERRAFPTLDGIGSTLQWVFADCGHRVEPHGIYEVECNEAGNECQELARLEKAMRATDHLVTFGEAA